MDSPPLRQLLALAGGFYWPAELNWDFIVFRLGETRGTRPMVLRPMSKFTVVREKDVPARAGYVWAGYVAANSPQAGFGIRYRGVQREFTQEYTFQDLYNLGLAQQVPGAFALNRFNQPSPPEYVLSLAPSLVFPFGRNFETYIVNRSDTSNAVVYDAVAILLLLYV
jgi:hypothetical protein